MGRLHWTVLFSQRECVWQLTQFLLLGKEVGDESDKTSWLGEIMRRIKLHAKPKYLLLQNQTKQNPIYLIGMYKEDLTLNNLQ